MRAIPPLNQYYTAMFKSHTVKVFSIVAMALSVIGLLLSTTLALMLSGEISLVFFMGIISWAILLWASYIGFRLCSYKLYEEEYKKVGIRIYLIIAAFILFFFVGVVLGLVVAVILLSTLWALKSNYDDWDNSDMPPPGITEETSPKV